MAGDGELGAARRDEVFGRAIDPIDRPGPPVDGRPGLDSPPAQDIAGAGCELAASLIAERFPVGTAVGMIHSPGDDAQGDIRPFCQPFELREGVACYAGRAVAGIEVVEQSDAQARRKAARRLVRLIPARSRVRFRSMDARSARERVLQGVGVDGRGLSIACQFR